jgi:acetyl esterase/lipase
MFATSVKQSPKQPLAWQRALLTLLLATILSGCSGSSLLNALVPHTGYTCHSNLAYGTDPRQHLDIYVPDKFAKSHATLIFFYGGSWQYGDKDQYRFIGQAFASKGFVTVIVNYRLYPHAYFPAFMTDSAKALVWVHNHIRTYGGAPNQLFLAGHSAGGFNAVMLTVNPIYLQQAGGKTAWIKGTIGIAGPYDFLPFTDPKVKALFSKVKAAETQPINFVRPELPPMLLVTGNQDTDVYPKNAIHLYNQLRRDHDPAELIIYPNIGHIGIVVSLAYGFRYKTPLLDDMTRFINETAAH